MRHGSTGLFYKGSHKIIQRFRPGFHEEGVHEAEFYKAPQFHKGSTNVLQRFHKGSTVCCGGRNTKQNRTFSRHDPEQ